MSRPLVLLALLAALGGASAARGAEGWSQLKAGMTLEKAAAAVGLPLIKSHGRGYDLWIYDGGAEVIAAQGIVVAWTAPAARNPVQSGPGVAAVVRPPAPAGPAKPTVAAKPALPVSEKAAVAQADGNSPAAHAVQPTS